LSFYREGPPYRCCLRLLSLLFLKIGVLSIQLVWQNLLLLSWRDFFSSYLDRLSFDELGIRATVSSW